MADLEARPGSPSVVVMAASDQSISHVAPRTAPYTSAPRSGRISPSGEEGATDSKTEGGVATLSLDEGAGARGGVAAGAMGGVTMPNLDDAWKDMQGIKLSTHIMCNLKDQFNFH